MWIRWQDPKDESIKKFVNGFLDGQYGDPLRILTGRPATDAAFAKFYAQCRQQIAEQRFLIGKWRFPAYGAIGRARSRRAASTR